MRERERERERRECARESVSRECPERMKSSEVAAVGCGGEGQNSRKGK